MKRDELSTVNFGLVMEGRLPPSMYKSDWFTSPYDQGIEILLKPGSSKEDVAKVLSSAYISDAHDAVAHWNGIGETENFDWPKSLRIAYENFQRGKKLEKLSKKLKENEEVDILPLYGELGAAIANESFGLKPASEIDYKTYKPFKLCGYAPIDNTLGGIPTDGPIIIYGLTGVGKSKFATAIIDGLLHKYPDETAAIYTLEMGEKHWLWRTLNLFPSMKDVLPRLHVSGSVKDIEELVAEVTAKRVNYVVLDDMDNMVKSSDASEYERIYRRVKEVCRFMGIPFFVLGQPNRSAKIAATDRKEGGRFLGRFDVAWSGAAENSAALQIALQTASGLDMADESFPTADDKMDYLIFWKSRDGWPGDYDPKKALGPGAVVMEHSSNWNGKPYGGKWKLWPVASGGRKMNKKSKKDE
jgi:hypothetical protein